MVSDAVHTLMGPLVRERYVTDVTSYTAPHRVMVAPNDSYPRSIDPLAIIYREVLKSHRLDLELRTRLVLKTAMKQEG